MQHLSTTTMTTEVDTWKY